MLNRPDEIPKVFSYALEHGADAANDKVPGQKELEHAEQLRIARKLRESLVKSAAIVGLPKVRFLEHQK